GAATSACSTVLIGRCCHKAPRQSPRIKRGTQDSNLEPAVLETAVLPVELVPPRSHASGGFGLNRAPSVRLYCEHMFVMYPLRSHALVGALLCQGLSDTAIARRTGVRRSTVNRWRREGFPTRRAKPQPDPNWRPPENS